MQLSFIPTVQRTFHFKLILSLSRFAAGAVWLLCVSATASVGYTMFHAVACSAVCVCVFVCSSAQLCSFSTGKLVNSSTVSLK